MTVIEKSQLYMNPFPKNIIFLRFVLPLLCIVVKLGLDHFGTVRFALPKARIKRADSKLRKVDCAIPLAE